MAKIKIHFSNPSKAINGRFVSQRDTVITVTCANSDSAVNAAIERESRRMGRNPSFWNQIS